MFTLKGKCMFSMMNLLSEDEYVPPNVNVSKRWFYVSKTILCLERRICVVGDVVSWKTNVCFESCVPGNKFVL